MNPGRDCPIDDILQMIDSWYSDVFTLMAENMDNMLFLGPDVPSTLDFSRLNRREKGLDRHLFRNRITRAGAYTGNKSYMFGADRKLKKHVSRLRQEGIGLADYLMDQADVFPKMAFKRGSLLAEGFHWLGFVFNEIKSVNGTVRGTVDRGGYFRTLAETAADLFDTMDDIANGHGYYDEEQEEDGAWGYPLSHEELYGTSLEPGEAADAEPPEYEERPYDYGSVDDGRMSYRKLHDLRRLDGLILLAEFGESGVYDEIEQLCGIWELDMERVDRYIAFRRHDYDSRMADFFMKKGRVERIDTLHMLNRLVRDGMKQGKLDTLNTYGGMITKLAISLAQSYEDDPEKGAHCPEWNMAFSLCETLNDYLARNGL